MNLSCKGTEVDLDQIFELFLNELAESGLAEIDQDLFFSNFVEAIHNAVEHGNNNCIEDSFDIETIVSNHFCLVSIKDQGEGFTPEFPELTSITGARGRGLGMIREYVDELLFNHKGNQIVFWKNFTSEKEMRNDLENASMEIQKLDGGTVLITNFILSPSGLLHHALSELILEKLSPESTLILLDASGIRVFSSLGWGVIANFLSQTSDRKIILFNISPAIEKMGQTLGFGEGGVYPNITLLPKLQNQPVGSF